MEQRQREYLQKTHGQAPQDGPYPPRNHPENQPGNHPDKGYTSRSTAPESANGYNSDPEMYAPDSRQDRYGRDDRYREPEQNGYTAPGPGFKVPRGRDGPGDTRGMQVAVRLVQRHANSKLTCNSHMSNKPSLNTVNKVFTEVAACGQHPNEEAHHGLRHAPSDRADQNHDVVGRTRARGIARPT